MPLSVERADHEEANPEPDIDRCGVDGRSGPRRSDPVDPAQEHERPAAAPATIIPVTSQKLPASAFASLIPKMPATAPMPARMTVTPVSRFMIVDRLLLTWVR